MFPFSHCQVGTTRYDVPAQLEPRGFIDSWCSVDNPFTIDIIQTQNVQPQLKTKTLALDEKPASCQQEYLCNDC